MKHRGGRILFLCLVLASSVGFGLRALSWVHAYAANVIFMDQWDLLDPLLLHQPATEWFTHTHGPHRQGLGGVLTCIVGSLTRFDGRAEAYICFVGLAVALAFALAIRRRLNGRFGLIDAVLPVIFFSGIQSHHLWFVPNNAHSTTPLALVLAIGYLFSRPAGRGRDAAIVILGFLTTFTGFGMFAGPLVPATLLAEGYLRDGDGVADGRQRRRRAGIAAAVSAALNATFLIRYHPQSANPRFGVATPTKYLHFVGDLFGSLAPEPSPDATRARGWILLACVVVAAIAAGVSLVRNATRGRNDDATPLPEGDRPILVPGPRDARLEIAFLCVFTLLFAAGCAAGRATIDPDAGTESRYLALLLPGLVGLTLALERLPHRAAGLVASLVLAFLVVQGHVAAPPVRPNLEMREGKERFARTYIELGDFVATVKATKFTTYPLPEEWGPRLDRKVGVLRERHLNLFKN